MDERDGDRVFLEWGFLVLADGSSSSSSSSRRDGEMDDDGGALVVGFIGDGDFFLLFSMMSVY